VQNLSKPSIQLRVIGALVLREMATRFGRSFGGYAWAIIEPAGFVAILSLAFSQIAHRPPLGESFAFYFATGYLAFHFYSDISGMTSQAVRVNLPLMSFPRVTPLDAIAARFLLQLITVLTVFIIMISAIAVVEHPQISLDLGMIFLSILLASTLGLAVGVVNCVLFAALPAWERLFTIINRPMFIISGVFFNMESLPRAAQDILWFNPLIHIVALMRKGFYSTYGGGFISVSFVLSLVLGLGFLGLLLLRALKSKVIEP